MRQYTDTAQIIVLAILVCGVEALNPGAIQKKLFLQQGTAAGVFRHHPHLQRADRRRPSPLFCGQLENRKDGPKTDSSNPLSEALNSAYPVTSALIQINESLYFASAEWALSFFTMEPALAFHPLLAFGCRADRVLSSPIRQGYRILSSPWLHSSREHLNSNMEALRIIGNTLEGHMGSKRFAGLVAVLVPLVGMLQLSLKFSLNLALRTCFGFGKAKNRVQGHRERLTVPFLIEDLLKEAVNRVLVAEAGIGNVGVGFSGVLFGLDAIASTVLEAEHVKYATTLTWLPQVIRSPIIRLLKMLDTDTTAKRKLHADSHKRAFDRVFAMQLSNPFISFTGHLAGVVAAAFLRNGHLGLISTGNCIDAVPCLCNARDPHDLMFSTSHDSHTYEPRLQIPLQIVVWRHARKSLLKPPDMVNLQPPCQ